MTVLVDTCVWSLALRRRGVQPGRLATALTRLIQQGRAAIIGPIRQELLSGIREHRHYSALRDALRHFPDRPLASDDFERAAEMFNVCRRKGIQGSNTDFLICAHAERCDLPILTLDKDFNAFAAVLPIRLLDTD